MEKIGVVSLTMLRLMVVTMLLVLVHAISWPMINKSNSDLVSSMQESRVSFTCSCVN